MKDNKYAPYILGPILLLVWGLVFYKIYHAVYGTEESFIVPSFDKIPIYEGAEEEKSFTLLLDYKDPFFGKKFKSSSTSYTNNSNNPRRSSNTQNPKEKPPIVTNNTPPKPFPKIVYQGQQILEQDTVALLKIGQRFFPIVRAGDLLKEVRVIGIFKDSIQLSYDGQGKTFMKKR